MGSGLESLARCVEQVTSLSELEAVGALLPWWDILPEHSSCCFTSVTAVVSLPTTVINYKLLACSQLDLHVAAQDCQPANFKQIVMVTYIAAGCFLKGLQEVGGFML